MKYKYQAGSGKNLKAVSVKRQLIFPIICVAIVFIGTSCEKENQEVKVASGNMIINNDLSLLSRRMTYSRNEPVVKFEDKTAEFKGEGNPTASIQLIARLLPPEYNGEVLQASHVRITGNYAYVAYNTQGSRYLGGVDVVDVTIPEDPQLISSVLFINPATNLGKDVSSVDVSNSQTGAGTTLWVTGADETTGKAFIEKYELNSSHQFISENPLSYPLKGYAGTDVRFFNGKVYVTSGTEGGLTVLDSELKEVGYSKINNARSVDVNQNFEIVLGGNPGHLCKPGEWDKEIGAAGDPEAKSIVRLHNNFALAALGDGGLKSYDLSSGNTAALASSLPRPTAPEGEPEWDWVTNGVSVSASGWVYLADGAAGLDVARIDNQGNLTWMGNAFMWASANYVECNSTNVFVARGTLGLKICKVTENQK